MQNFLKDLLKSSGPDPDPPDLHVFGLPGSVRGTDPDSSIVLLSSSKNSKKKP